MRRAALACALALTVGAVGAPAHPAAAAACGATGTATTTVYLPNITKTLGGPSGWVTPFIIQNVGTGATTLEVSFYRFNDGSLVTCRSVPGLLPATSFADVPNNDADLPGDSQFSVVVRSFGSEVVSVVNEHQGSGDRAEALSYVGLTQGRTGVYLPYVAKAVAGWTTTFVIQNLGTSDAHVIVIFNGADGSGASVTRTIGPGRSQFVDPSAEPSLAPGIEHAVALSSDQPIAVIANAHNDAPTALRPMGFSYNGLIDAATQPVSLPYVARNTDGVGRTTRVIVQNIGLTDATPTLAFRSSTGQQATIVAPAPVKRWRSWSFDPRFKADGVTPCPATASAGCVAEGEHGLVVSGGNFAVLGVTLSTATAMGTVAGRATSTRIYLPNITRTLGGATGWTTPIVIQREGGLDSVASSSTATLRWYRFSDGTLAVTQYVPGLAIGGSVKVDPRNVSGLADDTQYAVVVDAPGRAVATVLELSSLGGDGAMSYEGSYATAPVPTSPVPTTLTLSPTSAAVGTGATQQLVATVKDQSGNPFTGVPLTWTVTPATAGTVDAKGLFTAGQNAGPATVTATFGTLTATATLTIGSTTATTGGFTFNVRTTATADVYVERTISTVDAQTIATTVDADVADVQKTYLRAFTTRPPVYVFPTTATYTSGMQTVLGVPASEAAITGTQTSGFFRWESGPSGSSARLGLNWEKVKTERPVTTPRHELTHAMIQQVAKETAAKPIPAWINEGSAVLEEFTVSGTEYLRMRHRYSAASMVAVRNYFSLTDLTSQDAWNARTGDPRIAQYYEASQIVQLLRDDVGTAGVVRIFDLMGQGQGFETAFLTITGKPVSTFSSSVPTRLQALAPAYPNIATAPEEPGGPGLSYILYGFAPNSTVSLDIVGQTKGFENTTKSWTVDAYGVRFIYFGVGWPADTYSFTATGLTPPSSTQPNTTVTVRITAVKAASFGGLSLTW